jgi:hypothetical protein
LKIMIEIVGWTAAVMMLSAYVLLTTGRLRSLSPAYQWLNVLSGAGFIVNSGWNGAYPSAALNLIWMAIGLYGLFRGARVQPARRLNAFSTVGLQAPRAATEGPSLVVRWT